LLLLLLLLLVSTVMVAGLSTGWMFFLSPRQAASGYAENLVLNDNK